MSYAEQAAISGRIPVQFLELDMDYCTHTYGSSPCTAAVGTTGPRKCFNTYGGCQDKPNYTKTTKTYRYCTPNAVLPVGIQAFPLLSSIAFASQIITPGKGLGTRASVSVRLQDMPFSDAGCDPYLADRDYSPIDQGTFWGKWRARNKFYIGRLMRVRSGYIRQDGTLDWADFNDRVYVIESFKGPSRDGEVEFVGKDVLKLADDNKALMPKPSTGRLSADISSTDTSATLSPTGVGDLEYAASGRVVIGGEGIDYARTGDVLTLTRDVYNTGNKDHKADDTVQIVKRIVGQEIQDVIYDALTNYTPSFDAGWITKTDWDAERDNFLPGVWSTDICDPTGINTILGELTEQGQCYLWWDEVAQKVRFQALRPPQAGLPVLSDEVNNLHQSITVSEDVAARVSQVRAYYDRIDPTKKIDERNNYKQRYFNPDLEAEGPNEYGTAAITTVFSRWFQSSSLGRVEILAETLLKRYGNPPRVLEYKLDASNAQSCGDLFTTSTRVLQDDTGARDPVPMIVVSAQEEVAGTTFKIKAVERVWNERLNSSSSLLIYFSVDTLDVNLYDTFVAEYGIPLAGQAIEFVVLAGVVIGSAGRFKINYYSGSYHYELYSVSSDYVTGGSAGGRALTPSLTVDDRWPAGVTLKLTVQSGAIIAGAGGGSFGGNGIVYIGGDAIFAAFPISIDNQGIIGGGGGTGSDNVVSGITYHGGMGAGYINKPYPNTSFIGTQATVTTGGDGYPASVNSKKGGDLGQNGQTGSAGNNGAKGKYLVDRKVSGVSVVTWINAGSVVGSNSSFT